MRIWTGLPAARLSQPLSVLSPAGGELLDAVNNQGHYSEADARTIFCQLMAGIRYLHSK